MSVNVEKRELSGIVHTAFDLRIEPTIQLLFVSRSSVLLCVACEKHISLKKPRKLLIKTQMKNLHHNNYNVPVRYPKQKPSGLRAKPFELSALRNGGESNNYMENIVSCNDKTYNISE